MASTTFVDFDQSKPIVAAWLNDVNRLQYTILNNPNTAADALAALGTQSTTTADAKYAPIASGNPTGTIIDFAGTAAPTGYLACPTASGGAGLLARTGTYAALFAAIGTTWGAGDGSTTFQMPWFPADYAAVQANANVGTDTVGQVIAHSHTVSYTPSIGVSGSGNSLVGASTVSTSSTGGSANLAAGVRIMKCVKI